MKIPLPSATKLWRLALMLTALLASPAVWAHGPTAHPTHTLAPANDDCANATLLTSNTVCSATSGTTVAASQSLPAIACNGISTGTANDVWYKFVATASAQTVTVVGGALFDAVVDVRAGTCPGTNIGCADATGLAGIETVQLTGLTVGSIYYVRIYSFNNFSGTFTICVTGSAATTCAAVTNAVVTNNAVSGGLTTSTLTYTAAAGAVSYTVTLQQTGGTYPPGTVTGSSTVATLAGLSPGISYTATITTNCANGGTSSPVTVVFTAAGTPLANDECTGAISLPVASTCTPVSGTTVGASQSLTAAVTCGAGVVDDDVWYKFVATASAQTVTVVGGALFDAVVDVRAGACPGTNIGCADATGDGGTETVQLTGLTVGSTYYVRVYSYQGATNTQGTFTICVTGAAACAAVTNAAVAPFSATGTASAAQLTFTAVAGVNSYTLALKPTSSTSTPITYNITSSPARISGLTFNTSYTLTITTNCTSSSTSSPVTVVFTSPGASTAPPPANDECAGAISLPVASTCTPVSGTTVGASQSLAAITCGNFTGVPDDVWYKFVATASAQTVTVVGGTLFDAVVDVRAGTCPGTNIGCADATGDGGTETVQLTGLTAGSTYFVRVYSYRSGIAAPFTICVTGAAPTCPAPTALAAGSLTATGATLTFAPATGAASYLVTYTPQGGAAQAQTATGSPVALAGLTPGTTYAVSVTTNCGGGQTSTGVTTAFATTAPAPASVAVSAITATSASITFPAASGAVSYTVTYTAANGATATRTATSSPIQLTGLTVNTTYTVSLVANYPNGSSSAVTTTFTTLVLAVRTSLGGGELGVFPNPAHHAFTLTVPALSGIATARLSLVNALGQVVRQLPVRLMATGTRLPVDVADLAAGMYLVRVQAGTETAVVRLVIE